MKKLKKVLVSFGTLIIRLVSKVSAATLSEFNFIQETKYGIWEPTMGQKISSVGKFAISIILFIIGLFVILSKKITNKVKAIVISVLVILAILGVMLMNYIAINF